MAEAVAAGGKDEWTVATFPTMTKARGTPGTGVAGTAGGVGVELAARVRRTRSRREREYFEVLRKNVMKSSTSSSLTILPCA